MAGVETKTTGELLDEFMTCCLRLYEAQGLLMRGDRSPEVVEAAVQGNRRRNELMRAINRRLGERDIGDKLYREAEAQPVPHGQAQP